MLEDNELLRMVLAISPAAAVAVVIVVLFLKHLKTRDDDSRAFFCSLDERQAARDERLMNTLDQNTRTVARVEGLLAGRHRAPRPLTGEAENL